MDSIQKLIEALKELEPDFVSTNQSRAYQGIILTLAKTFPARYNEIQELLPRAATREIKKPVQLKSLNRNNAPAQQNSNCPTCGKGNGVVIVQQKSFVPNVLKVTRKPDVLEAVADNIAEVSSTLGTTLEEAANAIENFSQITSGVGTTFEEIGKTLETATGTGVRPVFKYACVGSE